VGEEGGLTVASDLASFMELVVHIGVFFVVTQNQSKQLGLAFLSHFTN